MQIPENRTYGTLEGPFVFQTDEIDRPQKVLVLLHGWGADGHDLASLGEGLQHMMPDIALWCPHGPAPCSANPMGRQWFELSERFFQSPEEALPEMETTADVIEAACEALCEDLDLPPSSVVIGGFSQGGMMALHLGTKGHFEAAGYASLSGALIGGVTPVADTSISFFVSHGTDDEVVPFAASKQAQADLEEAGYVVDFMARPQLGHGIDMATLDGLGQFCYKATLI